MEKRQFLLVAVARTVVSCTQDVARRYGLSDHFVLPPTAEEVAATQAALEEQERRAAAAKAVAAEQERQKAAAYEAEMKRVAEANRAAQEKQLKAEESPDNVCRDQATVRLLLWYFNDLDMARRSLIRANDITHITTLKNDPDNRVLACHGGFMLGYGQVFRGTILIRPNAAGDPIASWIWDFQTR